MLRGLWCCALKLALPILVPAFAQGTEEGDERAVSTTASEPIRTRNALGGRS